MMGRCVLASSSFTSATCKEAVKMAFARPLMEVCKLMHQMCPRHHQRSWLSTGWEGTGNFQNKIWLQRTCENGL